MANYMERLVTEYEELKTKTEKLRAFIWDGEVFETLPKPDQALLIEQHAVMRQYIEIIIIRMSRQRSSIGRRDDGQNNEGDLVDNS